MQHHGARQDVLPHSRHLRSGAQRRALRATARGGRQSSTNIRKRVVDRATDRANGSLLSVGSSPMPERLTPHSMRRTCASLLFALGWTAPEVMEHLGHTDPRLTLRIYARAMKHGDAEREQLLRLSLA